MSETNQTPPTVTHPRVVAPPKGNLPAVKAPLDPHTELVVKGNLALLKPDQLRAYYVELCHSLQLNPMTRPFQFIELNGKLIPYATKDCADQLRKNYKVSLRIVNRVTTEDTYAVEVQARTYDGREDFATGAVSLFKEDRNGPVKDKEGNPVRLRGSERANAIMKAETKAKRRATLSICGLGMTDETELETIRGAKPVSWTQVMGEKSGEDRASEEECEALVALAGEKGINPSQLVDLLDNNPMSLTREQLSLARKMIELRL